MSYFYPNAWEKEKKGLLNELIYEHSYWVLARFIFCLSLLDERYLVYEYYCF